MASLEVFDPRPRTRL